MQKIVPGTTEASAFSLEEVIEEPTETEEPVLVTTVYCKTYTYDIAGNRTGFTLEKGDEIVHNITYSYDNLNRLSTVSENGTVEATYTYDTNGNRASLTYANGVVTTYSYNLANWVTAVYNKKSTGTAISSYGYSYYVSGNQKSKTSISNSRVITTYTYDDLGRLTQEKENSGLTVNYSYDSAGNRSKMAASGMENYVVDYTYDNANRLLEEIKSSDSGMESKVYTYDNNGNNITIAAPESYQVNTYNLFNQLTATNINGSSSTYAYNTNGIRTAKSVNGVCTVFLLDGGNVVGEVQSGEVTATYLRGANLISRETDTAEQYYIFNAHGDVTGLVNNSQTVEKTYDYDAFGNEKDIVEADQNPFRYCGEYFDKETGTYYLRARYYDPSIGRFTQQDTHWNTANMIYGDNPNKINEREDALGLKTYTYAPSIGSIMQSGNLYVYCVNNPILYKDFTGNFVITVSATTLTLLKYVVVPFAVGFFSQAASDIVEYKLSGRQDGKYFSSSPTQYIMSGVSCVIAGPGAGLGRVVTACFVNEYVLSVEKAINGDNVTSGDFYESFVNAALFDSFCYAGGNILLKNHGTTGLITLNAPEETATILTLDDAYSVFVDVVDNNAKIVGDFFNEMSTSNPYSSMHGAGSRNPVVVKNYGGALYVY